MACFAEMEINETSVHPSQAYWLHIPTTPPGFRVGNLMRGVCFATWRIEELIEVIERNLQAISKRSREMKSVPRRREWWGVKNGSAESEF